jgi:hypothetical protein
MDKQMQIANEERFPPGVSTAFVVVEGAVDSLLGFGVNYNYGKHNKKINLKVEKGIDPTAGCYRMIDSTSATLTLSLRRETPRHLDLQRLQKEIVDFQNTVQTIIDRAVADGVEIAWIRCTDPERETSPVDGFFVEIMSSEKQQSSSLCTQDRTVYHRLLYAKSLWINYWDLSSCSLLSWKILC